MNIVKKLFSLCLVLTLLLSLAVPVLAADETFTITIRDPAEKHTYEAYQIFAGSFGDGSLGSVEWGQDFNTDHASSFVTALTTHAQLGTVFNGLAPNASAQDVADKLANAGLTHDAELTQHFADLLHTKVGSEYVYLLTGDGHPTASDGNHIVIDEKQNKGYKMTVPAGYYLIKDQDDSLEPDMHDFYTRLMLQVAGTVTVAPKGSVPYVKKHVNHQLNGTYTQATDINILGDVYFKLEGTLPDNYDKYESYTYTFVDTMPEGLEFYIENKNHNMNPNETGITDSLENMGGILECYVQHNSTSVTYLKMSPTEKEGYLEVDDRDMTGQPGRGDVYFNYDPTTRQITIKFYDLKTAPGHLLDDDIIVVKYVAKVNKKAIPGAGTDPNNIANENSVVLQFSNNPQGAGMGQTVEDTAEVYTYQLNIDKVAEIDHTNKLSGAIFLLGNRFAESTRAQEGVVNAGAVVDEEYDYMYPVFEVDKANNLYTLSDWVVTDVPIRNYEIQKVGEVDTYFAQDENGHPVYKKGTTNRVDLSNIMMVSNKDKSIKIKGLDAGSYLLRELEAPAGYNKITSTITVVITAEHNAETGKLTTFRVHALGNNVEGDIKTGELLLTLTNTKGAVLPTTGGIGTTIFYIAGGIMAVGALVLLITKKRMSEN